MPTDAVVPTGLKTGRLGVQSSQAASNLNAVSADATSGAQSAQEYLDRVEENVNKTIDAEVETLLESFKELISLATIGDKDKFRIAQESFQAQARADMMVRSAQSLSLLSESLKLSLLLSKSPDPSLDDEAIELMKSTEMEKLRCARSLERILGLESDEGTALLGEMDDPSSLLQQVKSDQLPAPEDDQRQPSAFVADPTTATGEDQNHVEGGQAIAADNDGGEEDEEDLEMEDV